MEVIKISRERSGCGWSGVDRKGGTGEKKEDVGSCRCVHNKLIVLDFP